MAKAIVVAAKTRATKTVKAETKTAPENGGKHVPQDVGTLVRRNRAGEGWGALAAEAGLGRSALIQRIKRVLKLKFFGDLPESAVKNKTLVA